MDFVYWHSQERTVSMRALLRQQVDDQHDLCDLTVKHGLWSKRYHACVLHASPFVQAMLRNNFNEKSKGLLILKHGTPESIDMALMSLYGMYPKLTMDNVYQMFDLAEFFLIPKLKSFCVYWIINETTVDEKNVENLLHLTSLYEFEMPKLTEYIRQHLLELLAGNRVLTISADTLENILSDATLSYVDADMWFEFVMRWVKHSPNQRKPLLDKIVACIELPKVTVGFIEKAKGDTNFEDLKNVLKTVPETVTKMQNVLIAHHQEGEFWVLDLGQEKWFRLDINTRDRFENSFSFNSSEPIICLVERSYNQYKIRLHDFETDQLSCTSLRLATSNDLNIPSVETVYISNKTCFVVLWTIGNPTLYSGAIGECGDETTLTPIFSLNVHFRIQLVVNKAKSIALFSKGHDFFCIHDELSCKFEKIDIKLHYDDEVSPYRDGFVIYDRTRIRFIQSKTDPRFERSVSFDKTCLKDKVGLCTYGAVGNILFRLQNPLLGSGKTNEAILDYTLDEQGKGYVNDVKWKKISLPDGFVHTSMIRNFQEIKIPRSKLICNVMCPHCIRIKQEQRKADINNESTDSYSLIGQNIDDYDGGDFYEFSDDDSY